MPVIQAPGSQRQGDHKFQAGFKTEFFFFFFLNQLWGSYAFVIFTVVSFPITILEEGRLTCPVIGGTSYIVS